MKEEYDVSGVPVVRTTSHPLPDNPLRRPQIGLKNAVFSLVMFVVLIMVFYGLSGIIFSGLEKGETYRMVLVFAVAIVYVHMVSVRAVIWLVHVYQRFAPDSVRLRCVFEPSCSEYMIMAVEKYGFTRGLWKGIKRLGRCQPPNYGKDYP